MPEAGADESSGAAADWRDRLDRTLDAVRAGVGSLLADPIQTAAAAVGVVSFALAIVVVTGIAGDRVLSVVRWLAPSQATAVTLGAVALPVGLWGLYRLRSSAGDTLALPESTPSEDLVRNVAGADFDARLSRYGNATTTETSWYDAEVRHRLTDLVVSVLTEHAGYDRAGAEAALDDGSWTADPRAAAYFAEEQRPPLRVQLVDWATGRRYARQVEAVVAELADVADVETGAGTARVADAAPTDERAADRGESGTTWAADLISGDTEREVERA